MPAAELQNRLLAALSPPLREAVLHDSQLIELPLRFPLYNSEEVPRYAYFLLSGAASVMFTSERGTTVAVSTMGNEGMIGWMFMLGSQVTAMECLVLVEGWACRVPITSLQRRFAEFPVFRTLVLEYAQHQSILAHQIIACTRLHRAEARLAHSLLMVQDRVHSDTIKITQEFLSVMVGTRRTTVVELAAVLENSGAIENRRGRVRIVDRHKLEGFACECYPRLKKLLALLYDRSQ